jgi:ABC-type lipoprotein export system ATPase subunit
MTGSSRSDANEDCLIRVADVVKYYADGNVTALNHVSLTINRGEYVTILGPSGCGKSTLLNLIGALDTPTSGEVFIKNEPLSKMRGLDHFRSQMIGFVFQQFHLLPTLTALENVQVPMFVKSFSVSQRVARARQLLAMVGLEHRLNMLPNKLSVGERQRAALARALANEPSVLLADEPTGNLDSRNGEEILDLFASLNRDRGMTLVVITHSAEVARRSEREIHLADGRIIRDERRKRAWEHLPEVEPVPPQPT